METRKLASFVRIVDLGSVTKAAASLHVAQPALSQQVASLENELRRPLLIRSRRGVTPTTAGMTLYRYAMTILPLVERTREAVAAAGDEPAGRVSIGVAPYSMAAELAPEIFAEVRRRYPHIVLHLTESHGRVLSEAVNSGDLDMALIYDPGTIRGLRFTPLLDEDLYLVAPAGDGDDDDAGPDVDTVGLAELATMELLLPETNHTIRQMIEREVAALGLSVPVVGEVESLTTLARLMQSGIGATVMPRSAAYAHFESPTFRAAHIIDPVLTCRLSLCAPESEPLSEAAAAVLVILREMYQEV